MSERESSTRRRRRLAALVLCMVVLGLSVESAAQDECLVTAKRSGGAVADEATVCAVAQGKTCSFDLQLCVNQAGGDCGAAALKKKVKAKGRCKGAAKLQVTPDASNGVCGSSVAVTVKTKKGKRDGKCKLRIATKASGKPARRDADTLLLLCKPSPGVCPQGTGVTTTTTLPPSCLTACDCCVVSVTDLARCIAP